jgi:nucleoside-diphosphate-sugar epimerase
MAGSPTIDLDHFHELLSHSHIFLTGATGFVGKVLLEKVLFTLGPKSPHFYLLIRPSTSQRTGPAPPEARLTHLLTGPIFQRCREKYTEEAFLDFARKSITVIPGDLSLITTLDQPFSSLLLDPQPEGWTKSVTAIIHCAASLQFEESIVMALRQNCAAALTLHAAACDPSIFPSIQTYLHVSTAYVQCDKFGTSYEVLPALSHLKLDDAALRALVKHICSTEEQPDLLGGYPNTYCLSKATAERLLGAQSRDLRGPPFVIVRPSIIGASVSEPIPGWVDSVNAVGGAMLFASLRIQREIAGIPIIRPDTVPVDRTVNCILLGIIVGGAGQAAGTDPLVLHASYQHDAWTWQHIADYSMSYCDRHVPSKALNAQPREFHFNPHKWLLNSSVFLTYKVSTCT